MEFWTQLLSEWSCVPNAFALVSLGGAVVAPLINEDSIASLLDVTVPLLIMITVLVGFAGLTLGLRELGKSINTDEYMIAREKWATVQFFSDLGYVPSKQGWQNDVFQLAKKNESYDKKYQSCLYESVLPLQRWLAKISKGNMESRRKLDFYAQYRNGLAAIRNKHYTNIEIQYEKLIEKGWLIEIEPTDKPLPYFDATYLKESESRRKMHIVVSIILLVCFWACYSGIYWVIEIAEAVKRGFGVLEDINGIYWVPFFIFIITYMFYCHVSIIYGLKSLHKALKFCFFCCNINPDVESRFESPHFVTDTIPYDKKFTPKLINRLTDDGTGNENGNDDSDTEIEEDKDYHDDDEEDGNNSNLINTNHATVNSTTNSHHDVENQMSNHVNNQTEIPK